MFSFISAKREKMKIKIKKKTRKKNNVDEGRAG